MLPGRSLIATADTGCDELDLIFARSALELIPESVKDHPQVRSSNRKKDWKATVLDSSLHYAGMRKLFEQERRGRPDIAHFCLLDALESPQAAKAELNVFLHCYTDDVLHFKQGTRLPRNQERFKGVIGSILFSKTSSPCIEYLGKQPLYDFVKKRNSPTLCFSQSGKASTFEKAADIVTDDHIVIVGGFPRGDFSKKELDSFDAVLSVSDLVMNAWTVSSRFLAAIERM